METIKQILRAPLYILDGIKYRLGGSLFTAKPRMIQFPVCDRCNSRCIMCNRWQKKIDKEIELEKIREVFQGDLFSEVEFVGLHGGEPTLRKDLAEICQIIQQACPSLKQLWISTNGLGSQRVEKRILEIFEKLDLTRLKTLDVNVSIDGLEDVHDKIRGIKGGFKQSIKTIEILKRLSEKYPIKISMGTVIQPLNLHQLDDVEKLASDLGVILNFQPMMFDTFFSVDKNPDLRFSKEDMQKFKEIMQTKLSSDASTTSFYWCDLLSMMKGSNRKSPCAFDRYVLSLYPTGEILPCSREDWIIYGNVYDEPVEKIWFGKRAKEVRERMKREVCPKCSSYCGVEFSLQKEFFTYLKFYLKRQFLKIKDTGKSA